MKVKELMSTKLPTVSPNDKLDRVFFLYNIENFRHLPVLEKNILVGITGSIAAYKAADLISRLKKSGACIKVVMTKSSTSISFMFTSLKSAKD